MLLSKLILIHTGLYYALEGHFLLNLKQAPSVNFSLTDQVMLPKEYERYEGLVICCMVIGGLLTLLFGSFILAYVFKWERLMTQIRIQRDNARREMGYESNSRKSHLRRSERIPMHNTPNGN